MTDTPTVQPPGSTPARKPSRAERRKARLEREAATRAWVESTLRQADSPLSVEFVERARRLDPAPPPRVPWYLSGQQATPPLSWDEDYARLRTTTLQRTLRDVESIPIELVNDAVRTRIGYLTELITARTHGLGRTRSVWSVSGGLPTLGKDHK